MRSRELCPCDETFDDGRPGIFTEPSLIASVVAKRATLLPECSLLRAIDGRLLIVDYEITNFNEGTETESHGFFDFADNPPWDLWVGEVGGRLIAWIPPCLVGTVERARPVEFMDMLRWVGEHYPPFEAPTWLLSYVGRLGS